MLEGGGGASNPRFSLSFWMAKAGLILPSQIRRVNRGLNRGFGELRRGRRRRRMIFSKVKK